MTAILIAALLGGASDCDDLVTRLPRDADASGLLEFGAACEAKSCASLAARVYEKVLALPEARAPARDRCEAAFRLARLEIDRKRHERAFGLLRDALSRCPDHAGARDLLRGAETAQTRAQAESLAAGEAAVAKQDLERALAAYEKALAATPEGPTASAYVPRSTVLSQLARCRDGLDQIRYEKQYLPQTRGMGPCPVCSGGAKKGFVDCAPCGADGKIIVSRLIRVGRTVQRVQEERVCGVCAGYGFQGCSQCGALGSVAGKISPKEKDALWKLLDKVRNPKLFRLPLEGAAREVEKVLLEVREGASLNFLRAVQPDYALSQAFRKEIRDFPLDPASSGKAQASWSAAEKDPRARLNFLVNYACEYADFVQPFDMLRQTKGPAKATRKRCDEWTGTIFSPELLSAFPDQADAGWIAVEGTLSGSRLGQPGEHKGYVEIQGAAPHTVGFFVWLPSARPHLQRLSDVAWAASLRGVDDGYPYELWDRISADRQKDHRVRVVGRFLRNRFGYPRNWLEIWDYQVGLSASQERMLRVLEDPVDISLPDIELRRVAEILRDWFDLDLRLGTAPPSARITASATECPKGLLLDAIARSALRMDWYWKDGQTILCAAGKSPISSDMAAVLDRLRARPPSTEATSVSAAISTTKAVAREVEPEGDVETLRRSALDEIRRMEYGKADRILARILADLRAGEDRAKLERLRSKVRVFDELTRRTPVSRLAAAKELTDLAYRKAAGELVRRTVVLTKGKDSKGKDVWTVQEAYGASFRIRPEQIETIKSLPVDEWRKLRIAELESKKAECGQASGASKASKLVLLALYAKTSGLCDQGTSFLNQAFAIPEFESVLAQFFSERSEELVALWMKASGRAAARTPAKEPAPAAEPARVDEPPADAVKPLPDGLSAGELLAHARRYAEAGSSCARKVMEGADAHAWRQRAIQNFEQGKLAVGKYLERNPEDSFGIRLRGQISAMVDTLRKDMGFFDG